MDVNSGEILSMASYPDYDPNIWVGGISQSDYSALQENNALYNRAISGTYAPGSTFKMATALAGLETGAITTTETIKDNGIYTRYSDYQPRCWLYTQSRRTHGYLTVSSAIQHSCNYFFYEVGYRLGINNIIKYAKYLGLGKKTGIELTGESEGKIASPEAASEAGDVWTDGQVLGAAIGQSYNLFTPIQMAKYISTLVNGGNQINPTIVKTIINADGTEVTKEEIEQHVSEILGTTQEEEEDLDISQENIDAILEGMRGVTSESGGTAYSIFRNFNIEIGGKTGSAQTGTSTNAWFVGFAPYDNPEIAIVVIIENRRIWKPSMLCCKRYHSTILWDERRRRRRKFNSNSICRIAKLKRKDVKTMARGKHSKEETNGTKELGLHIIEKSFNRKIEETVTKLHNGSLRSGNKLEFEGSIVVLGDINAGAEVIAEDHIIVLGAIRGLAHAGAKGNKRALIAANSIEAPQIRIANIVKEMERPEGHEELETIPIKTRAYVAGNEIIVE